MPQTPQPIDERVITALGSLDHALFPFRSFDRYGRVIIPPTGETTPPEIKELLEMLEPAFDRVAEQKDATGKPAWGRIFKILSYLDDSGWDLYTMGVSYGDGGLNLMPVKALTSVPDAEQAGRFSDGMQQLYLKSAQPHLPERPMFDPGVVNLLKRIAGNLETALGRPGGGGQGGGGQGGGGQGGGGQGGGGQGGGGGGQGGGGGGAGQGGGGGGGAPVVTDPATGAPVTPLNPDKNPPPANSQPPQTPEAAAATAAIVLALRFVAAFAEYASGLKERGWVTATTVWYVTDLMAGNADELKKTYRVLKKDDPSDGRRSVNVIWDPRNKDLLTWAREYSWQHGSPEITLTPNQLDLAFNPPGSLD